MAQFRRQYSARSSWNCSFGGHRDRVGMYRDAYLLSSSPAYVAGNRCRVTTKALWEIWRVGNGAGTVRTARRDARDAVYSRTDRSRVDESVVSRIPEAHHSGHSTASAMCVHSPLDHGVGTHLCCLGVVTLFQFRIGSPKKKTGAIRTCTGCKRTAFVPVQHGTPIGFCA